MIIYGEPQGKARPRFRRAGNFVQTYTPAKTLKYEQEIKNEYYLTHGKYYDEQPLFLRVHAYYGIPKSWSKKKQEKAINGEIRPCVKPDCDNVLKVVMDALNKVAYADDNQVCAIYVKKVYSMCPRIEVEITEIKE